MNKLVFIFLLLATICSNAQSWTPINGKQRFTSGLGLPVKDTIASTSADSAQIVLKGSDSTIYFRNKSYWKPLGGADSSKFVTYYGGDNRYFTLQPQNPTSSLSGGYAYERSTGSTIGSSVAWGAGRLAGGTNLRQTSTLASIVVNGVTQTFTQPAPGSSVSGSQSVTVPVNTNVTISNVVTTTTGETATSYTFYTFFDKRYIGWAATTTPTNAEIRAAVEQDNNGGSGNYSAPNLAKLTSALYLFYANTITCSSVVLNGFPSTSNFNLNVSRTFTNSSGGQATYYVSTITAPTGNVSATSATFN